MDSEKIDVDQIRKYRLKCIKKVKVLVYSKD